MVNALKIRSASQKHWLSLINSLFNDKHEIFRILFSSFFIFHHICFPSPLPAHPSTLLPSLSHLHLPSIDHCPSPCVPWLNSTHQLHFAFDPSSTSIWSQTSQSINVDPTRPILSYPYPYSPSSTCSIRRFSLFFSP